MRGDALKTFKNITSPNREKLGGILSVFPRKYMKPQSMVKAKHKFQQLVFVPEIQKLLDFLDELQKFAKDALGVAAQAIIEQFIYAKKRPHLKKSNNEAHLENDTPEEIVSHLEKVLELNGLEAPDEMQMNTVTQQATQQNSEKPKPTCHHCTKPGHYRNQCRQHKREITRPARNNTNSVDNTNNNNGSAQTYSNSNNKVSNSTNANNTNNQRDWRSRPVFPPCETFGRTNHSTEKCYLGANAANWPPPPPEQTAWRTKPSQTEKCSKQLRGQCPSCSPNFKLEKPRLHFGAASDRPETNGIPKLPPIPEVVWQQPTGTITDQVNLINTKNDSILHYTQEKMIVASQTSPPKEPNHRTT